MPTPKTTIVAMSPLKAEKFLKKNTKNRNVSQKAVDRYAREMEEGRWRFAGDPIRISSVGRLIDGQHRLHAIIKSGTTQQMLVLTGLDNDAFDVIDTGRGRTAGDVLSISGFANSGSLASFVRLILWSEEDRRMVSLRCPKYTNREVADRVRVSADPERLPELIRFANGEAKKMSYVVSKAKLAMCLYLTENHDQTGGMGARDFLAIVADNTRANSQRHPAVALRNWLTKRRVDRSVGQRDSWSATDIAGYIRAWNAWVRGDEISRIVINGRKVPLISTLNLE